MGEGLPRRREKVLLAIIAASVILGGCDTTQGLERPAVSEVVGSIEIGGEMYSAPEHAMSPDGKHVLATVRDGEGTHLVLVRVAAGEPAVVRIESISRTWLEKASFYYRPIGWISETRFLYAKIGWQPGGSRKGQRGMMLAVGDASTGKTEDTVFIPLESGGARTLFLPEQGKLLICSDPIPSYGGDEKVRLCVWDVAEKTLKTIRDDLPYNPYLKPAPSPTGEYYVYAREDQGKAGLYILDTATGEERILARNAETRSFYPAWSFDGKYIAAYTVGRKPGATGTSWHDYAVFEGEDTAQPVGESITVFDTHGNIVPSISVDGNYIASFMWAGNSHSLAFLAGPELRIDLWRTIARDTLWAASLPDGHSEFRTKKLATIPRSESGKPLWWNPVAFDAFGKGVYYQVYEKGTWYAREGGEPVQVSQGAWMGPAADGVHPVFGGGVLALVDEPGPKVALYFMVGRESIRFAEHPRAWVLAFNEDKLVVFAGTPVPPYPGSGRVVTYSVTPP